MKLKIALACVLFFNANINCLAFESVTPVSRYLTINNKPRPEQINLLTQVVQVKFPQNIQTIGMAVSYLLRFSGYSLISKKKMSPALLTMLSKPLPVVDRELGPVSLKDALMVLGGESFTLVQDPLNREINFLLKPGYQKYLK